ncbi:hypothetical protein D3C85_1790660 [compost metagenome]
MYVYNDKHRIRIQLGISIFILIVSTLFFVSSVYRYVECGGSGYAIVKAITALCVGSVMLRLSSK